MYTLLQHLQYNFWANEKIGSFVTAANEEWFTQQTPSSFNTLQKTLLHLWDAEHIWLKRIHGESLADYPSKNFEGSRADVVNGLLSSSKNLIQLIADSPVDYKDKSIRYKNMKGEEFSTSVESIMMHVVNHGTFHRGQVITMLRALGYTQVSSTDLITYLRTI